MCSLGEGLVAGVLLESVTLVERKQEALTAGLPLSFLFKHLAYSGTNQGPMRVTATLAAAGTSPSDLRVSYWPPFQYQHTRHQASGLGTLGGHSETTALS